MSKKITICFFLFYSIITFSQITVSKTPGSSVMTKLGYGITVNKGSSLIREKYTLNDGSCTIQLDNVGIETSYSDKYSFNAVGNLTTKEPIVAYEIHYILYDVFGNHMKTLSNTEITDIESTQNFPKSASWYATENNVSQYYICVSYVANVRTKNGQIWRCDLKSIKEQLTKLKIEFEDGYLPVKDKQ